MKKSFKDVNDKMMAEAGFVRHPTMDKPNFNCCGDITYWTHQDLGFNIITNKKEKMSLKKLIGYIADQAAHFTRKRLREKMLYIDYGENGFVKYNGD